MTGLRQIGAVCVGSVLLLIAPAVMAQAEPHLGLDGPALPQMVRVVVPACQEAPIEIPRLMEILGVELGQSGVALGGGEPTPPNQTALVIVDVPTCQGEVIDLRVEHLGTGNSAEREMTLTDTPVPERARVVALAVAELIRAAWAELAVEEAEEPPPPPPPPPQDHVTSDELEALRDQLATRLADLERARREDERPRPRVALDVAAGVRLFPSYDGTFTGGRIASSIRLGNRLPLRLVVDADFRYGRSQDKLGVGRAYLLTTWATLLATAHTRALELAAGVGIGLGWAWARGDAIDVVAIDSDMDGGVVAAAVRGQLDHQMNERLSLLIIIEAGYVILGLTPLAAGEPIVGVAGPFVAIDVGLAVSF